MSTSSVMDTSLRVKRQYRSWPEALKREIVAASFAPGASVSLVARQYDVNSNQVFAWRKRYGDASMARPGPPLVPVVVVDEATPTLGKVASEDRAAITVGLSDGTRVSISARASASLVMPVHTAGFPFLRRYLLSI